MRKSNGKGVELFYNYSRNLNEYSVMWKENGKLLIEKSLFTDDPLDADEFFTERLKELNNPLQEIDLTMI